MRLGWEPNGEWSALIAPSVADRAYAMTEDEWLDFCFPWRRFPLALRPYMKAYPLLSGDVIGLDSERMRQDGWAFA